MAAGPHVRPTRTGIVPTVSPDASNTVKSQRQPLLDVPVCLTFTQSITTPAGTPTPGASVVITWQPAANIIYDRYAMIGPTAATFYRIPWDGFYDFFGIVHFTPLPTQNFEWAIVMQVATTSDTGISGAVFNTINGPGGQQVREGWANTLGASTHLVPRFQYLFRAVELHANDCVQFAAVQVAAATTSFIIDSAEARYIGPIPNNMINIGQQT